MAELFHEWGTDLSFGPTGDLAVSSGSSAGQQRLLRRLLTNAGEYIWQTTYGAGLAQFVGQPVDVRRITAVIRSQMFKESTVSRDPEPVIEVVSSPGGANGTVYVHIRYIDSLSGNTQTLSFSVS